MKRIALFEFIPYGWFTEEAKDLFSKDKYEAEFEGDSMIDEMGIMLLIGTVLGILVILTLLIGLACKKSTQCLQLVTRVKTKLFWNSFIRFSLQYYLKSAFANFAALIALRWASAT